jgi:hypothetical protein
MLSGVGTDVEVLHPLRHEDRPADRRDLRGDLRAAVGAAPVEAAPPLPAETKRADVAAEPGPGVSILALFGWGVGALLGTITVVSGALLLAS